jgi:N,N-dimethylformamidase
MKKILGYTDAWSIAPGETLNVMVSTYGPKRYRADLVRVICGDDEPAHDLYREEEIEAPFSGEYPGRQQPIDAGSYAVVPNSPKLAALESFTVQAWIWPTTPLKGEQGLITRWDDDPALGFALLIDDTGALALRVGDGGGNTTEVSTGEPLAMRRWYLVSGSYDALTGEINVCQEPINVDHESHKVASLTSQVELRALAPSNSPLMFAAFPMTLSTGKPGSRCHYNGKIDRPRLTAGALSPVERSAMAEDPRPHERNTQLIGAWDFSRDIGGSAISDVGPNGLHGNTVNLPSRGCKGFNWSGTEQNWRHAPQEYGAIHFHDDDLYDARWETDFEYIVPDNLRSGAYAVHLKVDDDETYVPFFVRPTRGTTTSKLAFLVSTVTYMAYSNYQWLFHERFCEVTESGWTTLEKGDVFMQEHTEVGLSTYDTHSDGSGVRYASRLRPLLNLAPKAHLWNFNSDTHILVWLENQGIEYDVITDEDLHEEGAALLDGYQAVLTGTHPEYFTTPMWDGMRAYLARKGRLVYLGGNGFIWRCALSSEMPGVLELRRPEDGIRYRDEEPGEYYLEFTGEYGGLWRRLGMAPQALVGVGTVAVGFDASGYYVRKQASFDPRARFIFEGIGDDEVIGDFGFYGGGASGSEIDATDPMLGTPSHALVVASSEGHTENTYLVPDETGFHHSAMDGRQNPNIRADMTFFETPGGGAVFSVGSIAWGASLPHNDYDNNVSRITENVVRRFLDDDPFPMPE